MDHFEGKRGEGERRKRERKETNLKLGSDEQGSDASELHVGLWDITLVEGEEAIKEVRRKVEGLALKSILLTHLTVEEETSKIKPCQEREGWGGAGGRGAWR